MPRYLRGAAVRLFESSAECLNLAFVSLGLPSRIEARDSASRHAAVMGLVGTSAEQAMAAILSQIHGEEFLLLGHSKFKSATEILSDTRAALKSAVPRAGFLTIGLDEPKAHLAELARMTSQFPVLMTERAAGLHAGRGPSRDVAFVAASRVRDFLATLALSQRIRPYLENLPLPPESPKETSILIDELAAKLSEAQGDSERAALVRSLFLVLPDISDDAPEWLEAFERVAIAPTQNDIRLLLSVLETASPVRLQRASSSGEALSVVIRPDDPMAAPVSSHLMKRTFSEMVDQWRGDSASANGRIEQGTLHLPPEDFVVELFSVGREGITKALAQESVTPHELWPFIAAATFTKGKATPGPYWFLVRMTNDLGQLSSQLKKAFRLLKGKSVESRKTEVLEGIAAIRSGKPLIPSHPLVKETNRAQEAAETKREALAEAASRSRSNADRTLPADTELVLQRASEGKTGLSNAYFSIIETAEEKGLQYWSRMLAEAASDSEDREFLIAILDDDRLSGAKTAARKALRLIDAIDNGPPMEQAPA